MPVPLQSACGVASPVFIAVYEVFVFGGGTVKLSAGGRSNSGNGSAGLTFTTSSTVNATASADGSIDLYYSWSGSNGASCS